MITPNRPNGRSVLGEADTPARRVPPRPQRSLSRYEIFGPFELPLGTGTAVLDASPRALERFWGEVNGRESGLAEACGCFVFSVRGHNWRHELPWYVGGAHRQSFFSSCLDQSRIAIYTEVLARVPHASAYLHLLSRMTPTGRFSRPAQGLQREIGFVESLLIGTALACNSRLSFDADQDQAGPLSIPGLLNPQSQRLTIDARALRSVLGL
jgi:hypothetical protein